jgi:serine/threonine-protein kinase
VNSLKPTKELETGEVLSLSWELYKKHRTNLIVPFIIPGAVISLTYVWLLKPGPPWSLFVIEAPALIALIALAFMLNQVVAGVVIKYVGDVIEGGSPTLSSALNHVLKRMLDLIVASLLVTIIVSAGLLLLIVPGVILGIVLMLTIHAVILEGRGPIEALSRSRRLTSKRWAKAFLLLLIIGIISFIVGLIPLVGPLISIFANPYFTVTLTFFYYSMRAREAPPTPPPSPLTEAIIREVPAGPASEVPQPKPSPIQILPSGPVGVSLVDLGAVGSLRVAPLEGLVSGYGCSGSRLFVVILSSGVVPEGLEGKWACCLLGCGGWGCAYLLSRGGEKVVVKVPRGFEAIMEGGEAPTVDEGMLRRIKHEAEAVGSLNHPNIIRLLGASDKAPIVIYEYADYGSLYWQLAHGWRPSLKDVLLLGIQLGDAIRYAHSRGLVHGDIKPSNVLIKDKVAKLGDFSSMVRLLSSVSFSKMAYTVGFRAPEQVYADVRKRARELGVENRMDVYQLANVLLYALTGESVDGEEAVNDKLVSEKLSVVPSEELRSILAGALKLEPEKRPSAEEFTKMLYITWGKHQKSIGF